MGGGVTGWYQSFQVQTLALDKLNVYCYGYHACGYYCIFVSSCMMLRCLYDVIMYMYCDNMD